MTEQITYQDVLNQMRLPYELRKKELHKLISYKADKNERKFIANKFIYHHQIDNLCRVQNKWGRSFYIEMTHDAGKCYEEALKRKRTGTLATRILEAYRVNHGAAVVFKASTAKFLMKKYGATCVLDPTAGWGGRMLAAWSLGIDYVGYDTNKDMEPAYDAMFEDMTRYTLTSDHNGCDISMRYESCMDADFSTIDYDFVLTSPPYVNLEVYAHMTPWASDAAYYKDFLIPLITKCLTHINPGGWVCFNISPKMYDALLAHGFRACDEQHSLLQQKRKGVDKSDQVYCWKAPLGG